MNGDTPRGDGETPQEEVGPAVPAPEGAEPQDSNPDLMVPPGEAPVAPEKEKPFDYDAEVRAIVQEASARATALQRKIIQLGCGSERDFYRAAQEAKERQRIIGEHPTSEIARKKPLTDAEVFLINAHDAVSAKLKEIDAKKEEAMKVLEEKRKERTKGAFEANLRDIEGI